MLRRTKLGRYSFVVMMFRGNLAPNEPTSEICEWKIGKNHKKTCKFGKKIVFLGFLQIRFVCCLQTGFCFSFRRVSPKLASIPLVSCVKMRCAQIRRVLGFTWWNLLAPRKFGLRLMMSSKVCRAPSPGGLAFEHFLDTIILPS